MKTDAMNIPWVESPLFNSTLQQLKISDEQKRLATKFHQDGYVILDLGLSEEFIDNLKTDILSEQHKTQEGFYHYSDSPYRYRK